MTGCRSASASPARWTGLLAGAPCRRRERRSNVRKLVEHCRNVCLVELKFAFEQVSVARAISQPARPLEVSATIAANLYGHLPLHGIEPSQTPQVPVQAFQIASEGSELLGSQRCAEVSPKSTGSDRYLALHPVLVASHQGCDDDPSGAAGPYDDLNALHGDLPG